MAFDLWLASIDNEGLRGRCVMLLKEQDTDLDLRLQ